MLCRKLYSAVICNMWIKYLTVLCPSYFSFGWWLPKQPELCMEISSLNNSGSFIQGLLCLLLLSLHEEDLQKGLFSYGERHFLKSAYTLGEVLNFAEFGKRFSKPCGGPVLYKEQIRFRCSGEVVLSTCSLWLECWIIDNQNSSPWAHNRHINKIQCILI